MLCHQSSRHKCFCREDLQASLLQTRDCKISTLCEVLSSLMPKNNTTLEGLMPRSLE
uniref:Uncharacterized protein n=1 Tax=Triticum urartu TaxID=4572 RepID=A0A8R7V083_TRIUA